MLFVLRRCHLEINKIVVSNKVYFCKMDLNISLATKMLKKIRLLCIFLPKRTALVEETLMKLNICLFCFLTKDAELLEKYNETREKVKNNTKREFDSESAFNDKYLKGKLKSYQEKISTNFHNNEISKEGSQFISLSVIYLFICFIYLFICLFV